MLPAPRGTEQPRHARALRWRPKALAVRPEPARAGALPLLTLARAPQARTIQRVCAGSVPIPKALSSTPQSSHHHTPNRFSCRRHGSSKLHPSLRELLRSSWWHAAAPTEPKSASREPQEGWHRWASMARPKVAIRVRRCVPPPASTSTAIPATAEPAESPASRASRALLAPASARWG